jgi:preprotein translocase subunit SecD
VAGEPTRLQKTGLAIPRTFGRYNAMDFFASHKKVPKKPFDGIHCLSAFFFMVLGFLCCADFSGQLRAEEAGDLLLTLQVKSDQPVTAVMDAISKRAAALGAFKKDLVQIDSKTVTVRLPGYKEGVDKAVRIMEKQAVLQFKLVDVKADVVAAEKGDIPEGDEILYRVDRNLKTGETTRTPLVIKKQILMTGDAVTDTKVRHGEAGKMIIWMEFNRFGASELERITGEHVNEKLAIILDDRVYSAPVIRDRILGGVAIIEGLFTPEEALDLALVLRCGPINLPVEVVKSEWLKPSSGNR